MGRHRKPRDWNTVEALQEKHHLMIRLELLGKSHKEIAQVIGLSESHISSVLSSPLAQEQLAVLRRAADSKAIDISRMLQEEAPKCLELLRHIRDNNVETLGENAPLKLRMDAAESLLDRGGTSRIQNLRAVIGHAVVTEEVLGEIKQRAAEAKSRAREAGVLIDLPQREAI